ncbi:MAG TPA: glycine-rich protein [Bacteroidia bacterium]|jgi:hypothetical protein|nr:glycine-rich protein [Bacteroidia bacterium]
MIKRIFTIAFGFIAFSAIGQFRDSLGYTGAMQTWNVPPCVTSITVTLVGGSGGYSNNGAGKCCKGGNAGRVVGTLTVVPSSTLNIFVGGNGSDAKAPFSVQTPGGFNGGGMGSYGGSYAGGGGGGATDIRVGGVALANRVVVAGAGGGGAYNYGCGGPGLGPDHGGIGGGLIGTCGFEDYALSCGGPSNGGGGGGSQIAGGAGGNYSGGYCTAGSGSLGTGGDGCEPTNTGGGGGGGYYGGGAGNWEGGGGGSNYVAGLDSVIANLQGSDSIAAYVIIFYSNPVHTAPIAGPTVVCAGMTYTYSCDTSSGATYTWSFPAGTVINSGQGTDSVHVTFGVTPGTIKVVAVGTCGSDSATLVVTKVNPLPVVTLSAAKDTICVNNPKDTLIVSPLGGTLSGSGVSASNFDATVAGAGNHTVSYSFTDSNGCVKSDSITIHVNVCAGINEVVNLDDAVKLYPNPFSNEVNVNVDIDGIVSISMFNMLGENMGTWQVSKGSHMINTQGIAPGVYTMEVKTQYGILNKKLVKMN